MTKTPHLKIASRAKWLTARKKLLADEKRVTKWEKGCPGSTGYIDAIGDLSMLPERDTTFVVISRAPLAKLEAYKKLKGWDIRWHSSFGSDFNYDFHVTLDAKKAPREYNYGGKKELEARDAEPYFRKGEQHGLSAFFRLGDEVFHTYSTYARGTENLTNAYTLLDTTPYGRQEDFEDSPPGWPQKPTYGQKSTTDCAMSMLKLNITMSLDGYIASPNQSVDHPLGEGGEKLHEWAFAVRTFRERHGVEGGATGPNDDVAAEYFANVGAPS
jgi:predicted dithiol-disulfide oxidoreductase (DUF899 family)